MPSSTLTNRLQRAPLVARLRRPARWPMRGACCRPHRPDHAARLAFHLQETRHGCRQAEVVRVRRVDPADQRLGHALQGLAAESARDERAQALVCPLRPARQYQIQGHAQLARPGEQARRHQRPELRRRQQQEPIRQGMQPAVVHHVRAAVLVVGVCIRRRVKPMRSQSCSAHGFSEMNESGPASMTKPSTRSVLIEPPRRRRGFEQRQRIGRFALAAELHQPMCRGNTGNAAADDGDVWRSFHGHRLTRDAACAAARRPPACE